MAMKVKQSVMTGSEYGFMYQYMKRYIRSRTINPENNEKSLVMLAMVQGCILNHTLQELYLPR